VHDPTIIRVGDRYLCLSTSGNSFGMLRSSTDLVEWTPHGPVLSERPRWLQDALPDGRSLWAPDILPLPGGGLRMYYCASEKFGQNTSFIGVAECRDFDPLEPTRGWRDLGPVLASHAGRDNFNAIDPETIRDADGREWMFFGSYWSGLFVVELDPKTGKLKWPDESARVLVARNPSDPHNAIEAPAVLFRDGHFYLFASHGLAAQGVESSYRIVVGRSRSVTGPYVDRDGKPMLEGGHTLVLAASPPMYGPGHCDVFVDADGRRLLAHHFYDGRERWGHDPQGRERWGLPTLQVRELIWDKDGWPLPGLPVGMRHPTPATSLAGEWIEQVDFGEPKQIRLTADDPRVAGYRVSPDRNYYVGRNARGQVVRGARVTD
jgi:arabinan endo-1,5-alpha-L-arabinosidase